MKLLLALLCASMAGGVCIVAFGVLSFLCGGSYSAKFRKKIWILIAASMLLPLNMVKMPASFVIRMPEISDAAQRIRNLLIAEKGGGGNAAQDNMAVESKNQSKKDQSRKNQKTETQNNSAQDNGTQNNNGLTIDDQTDVEGVFSNQTKKGSEGSPGDKGGVEERVLLEVWLAVGMMLFFFWLSGYLWVYRRSWKNSARNDSEAVNETICRIARGINMNSKRLPSVRILQNSGRGAFTIGIFHRIIFLPEEDFENERLYYILKHEMIHCREQDIFWKLLFLIVNAVHWFNPLVWLMRKKFEQELELACDEAVLSGTSKAERREYGELLMTQIEKNNRSRIYLTTGYAQEMRFVKRRFRAIFDDGKKEPGIVLTAGFCCIFLLVPALLRLGRENEILMEGGFADEGQITAVESGEGLMDQDMQISEEVSIGNSDIAPVRMHTFGRDEVLVVPAADQYDFQSAGKTGKITEIYGNLPGASLGTWYTVEIEGVEYYFARYDGQAEGIQPACYGYSIVSKAHVLANGISVGMTKKEILAAYPDMSMEDFEGNQMNEVSGSMGWNFTSYPRSSSASDVDENSSGGSYYWHDQFDYILIAGIDVGAEDVLPMYVGLLMKDDVVAAITFFYPTAA